jgi:hypothetical protein
MAPIRKRFSPNSANHIEYMELYKKYRDLYSAVKGLGKDE